MDYINEYEQFIDENNIDVLPEPYRTIARETDVKTALSLSRLFGGSSMYFPKADRALQSIRNQRIVTEFNGGNITRLARKYNLTETRIRQILDEEHINENQLALFGDN